MLLLPLAVPDADELYDAKDAKIQLGLTEKKVLTIFGFIASKKGYFQAIDILEQLPPNFVLLIAGGVHPDDRSEYVQKLRDAISAKKLDARVTITEYLTPSEMCRVMAATDIALAPFTESSGSASLAQLFSSGKAVVASNITPFIEINASPEAPLLLCGNSSEYVQSILRIASSDEMKGELERKSVQYAQSHSFRMLAAQLVQTYESIRN